MTAANFKSDRNSQPSVIIVGAGPIGLYTAYVLAGAGCQVQVIDDGRRGAGWASGGMLGAAYEILGDPNTPDVFKTFARASQCLWSQFLTHVGANYIKSSVFIAATPQDVARLTNLSQIAPDFSTHVAPLELPGGMSGGQAWSCLTDVAFDPRLMLGLLRRECEAKDVVVRRGAVTHVEAGDVILGDGTALSAGHIVVATGQAGNALSQSVPELAHLAPIKGQMLAIAGSGVALDRVVRAGRIYLVPRGDLIVVGATSNPNDDDLSTLDHTSHRALYDEAVTLCPALSQGQVVESWAGLRPMTPDGLPLVGHSQRSRVLIAAGTYRNGWLLAAGIANSLTGLIMGQTPPEANLQLFAPNRFPTSPNRTKCPDK